MTSTRNKEWKTHSSLSDGTRHGLHNRAEPAPSPIAKSCLGCGCRGKQLPWMDKMKVKGGERRALKVTHSDLIGFEELGWFWLSFWG